MCALVFSKPMDRPFLRQKVNIHPCGHLRAGAEYNIIDAGGSGTKNYSSLQERVGAAAAGAKSFSVISHHGFQPVFKCRGVNPCLRKLAFTHSLIELETQPYRTLRGKGGKCYCCYTEFCDPPKSVAPGGAVAHFLQHARVHYNKKHK